MSVFDTEMFIVSVEKHECLWKISCKDYADKHAKLRAWNNIGCDVFDEWENYDENEKRIKIEELKCKWKNIRDNYTRSINETRKVKSGSEAKSKQSYAYGDVLSFLIPVMKKRKTTGNMDNTENIDIMENNDNYDGDNSISQSQVTIPASDLSNKKKKKDQNNLDFQKTLVEFMKNPPLKPPEEFDADKAFLLSFLPDLKKMNDAQKWDLKIEFLNAVKRIITAPQPNNIYQNYTDYSNQQNLTNHQIHHPSNAFLPHFQTSFTPYSYPSTYSAALNNPGTSNTEEDRI